MKRMILKFTKRNLFEQYANSLRREKIPPTQLEAAHLDTFAKFSHTHNYGLPQANDLAIFQSQRLVLAQYFLKSPSCI